LTSSEARVTALATDQLPLSLADEGLLADAVLGGGLPEAAEQELALAAASYHLGEVAERHLGQARRLAPDHVAVLIGLYRFYFYKGRLAEALEVARLCLEKATRDNRLPADWRDVCVTDADFGVYDKPLPRFYLFTLKGFAYLNMRLGDLAEGRDAVMKLLELDPSDKVGAKVLLDVLDRVGQEDG
jgi:tetratricopeptide (TPR) repeat protein